MGTAPARAPEFLAVQFMIGSGSRPPEEGTARWTLQIHDLVALQSSLVSDDAAVVSSDDIDVLVPWNIAGPDSRRLRLMTADRIQGGVLALRYRLAQPAR